MEYGRSTWCKISNQYIFDDIMSKTHHMPSTSGWKSLSLEMKSRLSNSMDFRSKILTKYTLMPIWSIFQNYSKILVHNNLRIGKCI